MIEVEPLPKGTTGIDTAEAGREYVDEAKTLVYGAIDPVPTIFEKLDGLAQAIEQRPDTAFNCPERELS
jgi:hypothetical protein